MSGLNRYLQALWDNLGGLLGGNLLTFLGCLPLALGLSLGLIYENIWIVLLSGPAGGAVAGVFWTAMLSLAFQAFQVGTRGWFSRWRRAVRQSLLPSAGTGAVLGLLCGGLDLAGAFAGHLLGQGAVPLPIWLFLGFDFFLLSLAGTLIFPVLCVREERPQWKDFLTLLFSAPGRMCAAACGTLVWCGLGTGLFPVSVPFALALGFWPLALFIAQMTLPVLEEHFSVKFEPLADVRDLSSRQRGEIFWRRRWPLVVGGVVCVSLILGTVNVLLSRREPDLQIAVVHAQPLPDGVREALERSLAGLVGDRNGDGKALAQVNDYTVVFDGSAVNPDMQTAGATLLVSDIAAGTSALYLVEDRERFLARYGDKVNRGQIVPWSECPALAGLDAGVYSILEDISTDLSGQSLLAPLIVLPSLSAEEELLSQLLSSTD